MTIPLHFPAAMLVPLKSVRHERTLRGIIKSSNACKQVAHEVLTGVLNACYQVMKHKQECCQTCCNRIVNISQTHCKHIVDRL